MTGLDLIPETTPTSPFCTCPADARGPWDCGDCPEHGAAADAEVEAQARSEQMAESAWLRYAELPADDCPEWAR